MEVPKTDLMETPFNCQVPQFFSHLLYPQALSLDSLSEMALQKVYLFPPIALILKSLLKIMEEGVPAIVIALFWPRRP